jgi:serine/threonine protein kinase
LPSIWKNVTNQYNLESIIGEGSYGVVAKGYCKVTGQAVAIKLVKDFSKWEYDCVKAIREIQIMRKVTKM